MQLMKSNKQGGLDLYDSLAEAYLKLGDKKLAAENYKRCVELNPKNDYAAEQLKKLQGGVN